MRDRKRWLLLDVGVLCHPGRGIVDLLHLAYRQAIAMWVLLFMRLFKARREWKTD